MAVALLAQFIAPGNTMLTVCPHSSIGGGTYDVLLPNGQKLFYVHGHSLSARVDFSLADGSPLFSLHHRTFSQRRAYTLEHPAAGTILSIHKRCSFGSPKFDAHFRNAATPAGEEVVVELRSGAWSKHLDLTVGGRQIASVDKKSRLFSSPTFHVSIVAGVDQAMVVALVVAFYEEKKRQARAAAASGGGGGGGGGG